MNLIKKLIVVIGLLNFLSCNNTEVNTENSNNYEKQLQEKLITAQEGEIIEIPEGIFHFTRSLILDGINKITIKGAGKGKTVLSFKNQVDGAEGIKVTANDIKIENLTVQDTKGDAIKVQDANGVIFQNVGVAWTEGPKPTNGAYGLYPVSCSNVLIENCEVTGASDAGIYVGQSENIIVRKNKAYKNVAGIEIENSMYADVYENESYDNTGGILIFDLPELPKKNGHSIRVYNNKVYANNHYNFAPEGNTVALIPAGTGMLVLATRNVEFFNNEVKNHQTTSLAIVSYPTTGKPFTDSLYNPFTSAVFVHDNVFIQSAALPDTSKALGKLTAMLFNGNTPHVLYDGFTDPTAVSADKNISPEKRICIVNNGEIKIADFNAPGGFKKINTDASIFDCTLSPVKEVVL
jgi:parallel beta-helix repeat protein